MPRLRRGKPNQPQAEMPSTETAKACSTVFEPSEITVAQPDQGVRVKRQRKGHVGTGWRAARAKRTFLTDYAQWANITAACAAACISRTTFYQWQEHDEDFALGVRAAAEAATERLEREAYRRAIEGSPYERTSYWHGEPVGTDRKIEYSDQLMMLLLRARRPDLYREKVDLAVTTVIKTVAGVDPASVL